MRLNHTFLLYLMLFYLISALESCDHSEKPKHSITITVTATAFNAVEAQTKKGNVALAAWGDTLVPGEKAIAVSRDLIKKGLTHNKVVEIEGLAGEYVVKDKMNKRWTNKIDIYMGLDEKAAKEWGRQKVKIKYDTIN